MSGKQTLPEIQRELGVQPPRASMDFIKTLLDRALDLSTQQHKLFVALESAFNTNGIELERSTIYAVHQLRSALTHLDNELRIMRGGEPTIRSTDPSGQVTQGAKRDGAN